MNRTEFSGSVRRVKPRWRSPTWAALLLIAAFSLVTANFSAQPSLASGPVSVATDIEIGSNHGCVVIAGGLLRCWGSNEYGKLGYGNTNSPISIASSIQNGDVNIGGVVTGISVGSQHACALMSTGTVRCFGNGAVGQLGYGNTNSIGDDETPASAGDVPLGGVATAISAGHSHTCALMTTGSIRCWGYGADGRLGYGQGLNQFVNAENIGDNETPATVGDVPLGGTAIGVSAGGEHTCALMSTGAVRCFGLGTWGRLGYASTNSVGDNETPASVGDVPLGGTATAVSAGWQLTCALMSSGSIRCWGRQYLGYGNNRTLIGDNEPPASVGDVPLGGLATGVFVGSGSVCAIMTTKNIRCWGDGASFQLGYGNSNNIGDDETPASVGDVQIGVNVTKVVAGDDHTCVLLESSAVRCWGSGMYGKLGNGSTQNLGYNMFPSSIPDIYLGASSPPSTPSTTISVLIPRQQVLTIRIGKKKTLKSLLATKGVVIRSGTKVSALISTSSKKTCKVSGFAVRASKAGTCKIIISVKPKNAKLIKVSFNLKVSS